MSGFSASLFRADILIFIIVLFVETLRKFITAKLSIRKPGSSSVLIILLASVLIILLAC